MHAIASSGPRSQGVCRRATAIQTAVDFSLAASLMMSHRVSSSDELVLDATATLVQSIHGCLVPHRKPSAVRINRQLNRGVAKLPLNVGRALTLLEKEACERVPEAVR